MLDAPTFRRSGITGAGRDGIERIEAAARLLRWQRCWIKRDKARPFAQNELIDGVELLLCQRARMNDGEHVHTGMVVKSGASFVTSIKRPISVANTD